RCGSILEKLPIMLAKLQRMAIDFLNVLQAAHRSFLEEGLLDTFGARCTSLSGTSHLPPETTRQHAVVKITPSA
ncbi:MAG: hypothetical protein WCC08_06435, partial [Terrimicrobiaceae bacterium]